MLWDEDEDDDDELKSNETYLIHTTEIDSLIEGLIKQRGSSLQNRCSIFLFNIHFHCNCAFYRKLKKHKFQIDMKQKQFMKWKKMNRRGDMKMHK